MRKIAMYVDRTEAIKCLSAGKRILHLGCVGFTDCTGAEKIRLAVGSLHQLLTDCCDCVGVDLDRDSIEQLQRQDIFRNILFGDVEALDEVDFGPIPFDGVVAGDIIEHLSNPGRMLNGIRGILKPDGFLLLTTPNAFGLLPFLRHLRGTFREGLQHVLAFNAYGLQQLLARHGFRTCEICTCHQPAAKSIHGAKFHAGRLFFKRFPRLGGTLLVVARLRHPTPAKI